MLLTVLAQSSILLYHLFYFWINAHAPLHGLSSGQGSWCISCSIYLLCWASSLFIRLPFMAWGEQNGNYGASIVLMVKAAVTVLT